MSDTTATLFEAPEVEEVSRLFPSYEILGLIACGGMGAVYHAIQTSLERAVAIKILPREFSTDAEFRAGFESEAKAMAKLNHPNLIGVYDFGDVEGMLFIVMEYVAGESLYHAAHGCAVEHADAVAIVIGVCHGLAHAHEHGILHRDIKPSNILLDGQTNPKIGDFGLARALEREIKEGEQIFGTPGYTAPEVLEPPFTIDQRADIFSVGVMLHELLTGKLPDADPRLASQICHCNYRLDAVIVRATYPDPARRYVSALELAKELEKIASTSNRMQRTGSTPAAMRSTAVTRVSAAPVPSRPAAHGARPKPKSSFGNQATFRHQRPVVKQSSGFGYVILLLIVIVVAAAMYLVMKDKVKSHLTAPAPPQPVPIQTVVVTEPAAAPVVGAQEGPEIVLHRARTAIRQRVAPAIESYKRDMKANLIDFKTAIETASRDLSMRDRAQVAAALTENLPIWENKGHRLSQALPDEFNVLGGAANIHSGYVEKQAAIQRKIETDISSLTGIYVMELQNYIGQLEKDGNTRALHAVEDEVRAINADPARLRSLILE